jgi:hypothetical protein
MTDPKSNGGEHGQSAKDQATIRWTDSGIKGSYANSCTVSNTREEVVLNFGLNQAWERGQTEVQLTNRIILSPYVAKRVALLLNAVMQQYEGRFGVLDMSAGQAPPSPDTKPHAVK